MWISGYRLLNIAVTRRRPSLSRFSVDERGDNENLGRLLLLTLVLIPLVLLVLFFGQNVFDLAKQKWGELPDSVGSQSTALVPCRPGMGCFEE